MSHHYTMAVEMAACWQRVKPVMCSNPLEDFFFYPSCSIMCDSHMILCSFIAQHCWSELWAVPWRFLQTLRGAPRVSNWMHTWAECFFLYFSTFWLLLLLVKFPLSCSAKRLYFFLPCLQLCALKVKASKELSTYANGFLLFDSPAAQ